MEDKELVSGESIYLVVKPHPLSYWHFYVFFIYYIVMSMIVLTYKDAIVSAVESSIFGALGELAIDIVFVLMMWAVLVIPAAIFSVLRIAWKWLILYVLLASVLTYVYVRYALAPTHLFLIVAGIGVVGILLVDFYRRAHEYIITNFRIITKEGGLTKKTRDIFYDDISDVVVIQGLLGKIFKYGTIVPVTPSGIGTGQDIAQVTVGTGAHAKAPQEVAGVAAGVAISGAKSVVVPRGRESMILYGIPDPWELRKLIIDLKKKEDPVTYLKEVVSLLKQTTAK